LDPNISNIHVNNNKDKGVITILPLSARAQALACLVVLGNADAYLMRRR
jgi:hypothetical protein